MYQDLSFLLPAYIRPSPSSCGWARFNLLSCWRGNFWDTKNKILKAWSTRVIGTKNTETCVKHMHQGKWKCEKKEETRGPASTGHPGWQFWLPAARWRLPGCPWRKALAACLICWMTLSFFLTLSCWSVSQEDVCYQKSIFWGLN